MDEALRRPGRFGVHLEIPMPNLEQREAILRVHAGGIRFDEGVDFALIAAQTGGPMAPPPADPSSSSF